MVNQRYEETVEEGCLNMDWNLLEDRAQILMIFGALILIALGAGII